MPKIF